MTLSSLATLAAVMVTPAAAGRASTASTAATCPAHWTSGSRPLPALPNRVPGAARAMTVLSPTDAWAVVFVPGGHEGVYHYDGTQWQGPQEPWAPATFDVVALAATSDSNVWAVGSTFHGNVEQVPIVWHFDGTSWSNDSPAIARKAALTAAVIAKNGDLYVAGTNFTTKTGVVWKWDGTAWTDITPPDPAPAYNGLALTGGGTLVAVGAKPGPVLQEMTPGGTWATVTVPAGTPSLTAVTPAPDGTVFAAGSTGKGPVLVRQLPSAASASALSAPPPPGVHGQVTETGLAATGPADVWLLGQYVTPSGTQLLPWVVHFDGTGFLPASLPPFPHGEGTVSGGTSIGPDVTTFGGWMPAGREDPKLMAVCPVQVGNSSLTPAATSAAIGDTTYWSVPVTDRGDHRLVSAGVFGSGTLRPGGSFGYTVFAAATYTIRDARTGARSTLAVPPIVTPASGGSGTVFTVVDADHTAPVGFRYQVLLKSPGARKYVLLTSTAQAKITFLGRKAGAYSIKVQLRTPAGLTAASPATTIHVS